jgi:hypothetical protein
MIKTDVDLRIAEEDIFKTFKSYGRVEIKNYKIHTTPALFTDGRQNWLVEENIISFNDKKLRTAERQS